MKQTASTAAEAPSLASYKRELGRFLKGIYPLAMNLNPNDECQVVSSGQVPRYPQGRQIGHTQMGT